MSLNRENVIWQSKDGTWNRAFYDFVYVNEDNEDFDMEWDVEYSGNFDWVSMGHPTMDAADKSWYGANPGCFDLVEYSQENADICAKFDENAKKVKVFLPRPYSLH